MWKILMCCFLYASCSATTAPINDAVNTDEPLITTTLAIEGKPEVNEESNAIKPSEKPEEKPEEPALPVTYDQRQEGQYNFRADLDNFMIVLVPQNPLEGLNLNILDLLTRSHSKNNPSTKQSPNKRPLVQRPQEQHYNFRQPLISLMSGNQKKVNEMIEGRTPYQVDLSPEDYLSQIHSKKPVGVFQPMYPIQNIY